MDKTAAARYGKWKNALLDTSKVNKQLNFRPAQKTNVEIIFPDFQQAIKNFVIVGSEAEFMPVYVPKGKVLDVALDESGDAANEVPAAASDDMTGMTVDQVRDTTKEPSLEPDIESSIEHGTGQDNEPGLSTGSGGVSFIDRVDTAHAAAIEKARNKARITKDIITNRADDDLQRVLRQLFRAAKSFEEEKGINILHLAIGLLRWTEPGAEKTTIHSPLLMVPVTITRASVIDPFKIVPTEDEAFVNPTIKEKFRADFGIALDDLPPDYNAEAVDAFFSSIEQKIAARPSWGVERRVFLGTFSFTKIMMFNDLANNAARFLGHPIISCLASQTPYAEPREHAMVDADWNDALPPDASYTILDSDSSQFKAIQAAKKGASMIIHGPPGTGKSQCIANIIADCIASGKKVLFVAQKMAALEVVRKRLEDRGIGRFCLDLFSHQANKTDLLTAVMRNARFSIENDQVNLHEYEDLATIRSRLNDYVARMHLPVGKGGLTIYQVIGELTRLRGVQAIDAAIGTPQDLTSADRGRIEDAIAQIDVARLASYYQHPWARSAIQSNDGVIFDTVPAGIKAMKATVEAQKQRVDAFNNRRYLVPIKGLEEINAYKAFFEVFNSQALCIDGAAIRSNFRYKYTSPARVLSRSYRRERKLVLGALRGAKYSDFEHVSSVVEDLAFQQKKILLEPVASQSEAREVKAQFDEIDAAQQTITEHEAKLAALNFTTFDPGNGAWDQLANALAYYDGILDQFEDWLELHVARDQLRAAHAEDFFDKLRGKPLAGIDLVETWQKTFYQQWLSRASATVFNIKNFKSSYHEVLIQKFIDNDRRCIDLNAIRLAKRIRDELPALDVAASMRSSEMGILEQESRKKRNVKPIRQILSATKNLTAALAPCFMMSPLSVAAYLPIEAFDQFFDVVIFDEASQVCPEDAVGAILRAKQLIVAGDEKQMPPTRFFQADMEAGNGEDDVPVFDSLLDEAATIGLTNVMLKWHYRSRKEGLIAFSNQHFYDNNLVTFPDNGRHKAEQGRAARDAAVQFIHVPEGRFVNQRNTAEARAVARAVIEHFKATPDKSLGVVAMGISQEEAIANEIEKFFKADPALEQLVKAQKQEPLFIKNLESVQGDERDVIYLSIGYGKNQAGVLHLNFGPVNKAGGERRLNVAITRARHLVKTFCSFLPVEVDLKRSGSPSFHKLIHYLEFARTGELPKVPGADAALVRPFGSPIEEALHSALVAKGLVVDTQVGCSGYRIDLAIVNPDQPSTYILGIVCDGRSYRAGETARDRDRLRHQVLEGLGWNLMHVWSPDWLNRPDEVLARIEKRVGELRKRATQVAAKRGDVPAGITIDPGTGMAPAPVDLASPGLAGNSQVAGTTIGSASIEMDTPGTATTSGSAASIEPSIHMESERKPRVEKKPLNADTIPHYVEKSTTEGPGQVKPPGSTDIEAFKKRLVQAGSCTQYREFTLTGGKIDDFTRSVVVREMLAKQIIDVEGPIHRDLLVKRVQAYYDVKVLGKNLKEAIGEILLLMPSKDDFFYPAGFAPGTIRICVDGAEDPREIGQIPPPELRGCLAMLVNEALTIETDELFAKVARVFGHRQLKDSTRQLLATHLDALVAEGLVTVADGIVTNVRKDAWKEATFGLDKVPTNSLKRGGTCKGCAHAVAKPGKTIKKGDTSYYKEPCLVCAVSGKETPDESWCKSFEPKVPSS